MQRKTSTRNSRKNWKTKGSNMGIVDKIKEKIGGKEEQEGASMPPRYQVVTWNQAARNQGVGGDRNKTIQVIERGEVKETFPYSKSTVKALREKRNLVVWDETGGSSVPETDVLHKYDPGLVSYDQANLRDERRN
jgi:hypothetical protein